MGLILSIIVGGVVGWVVSFLMKTNSEQDTVFNIAVGIIGAVLAGLIMSIIGNGYLFGFNFYCFVVALIGAVVLTSIVKRYGGYGYFKTKF